MSDTRIPSIRIGAGRRPLWVGTLCVLAFASAGAHAADATIENKAEACMTCHGPRGQSAKDTMPSLAGQTAAYLYLALEDFKARHRDSRTMSSIAETLSAEDMRALADYFSAQPCMSSNYTVDPVNVAKGKAIAAASQCATCHQAGFTGQNEVPLVAGQQYHYIVKALEGFRSGRRTGEIMQTYARGMVDDDIDAVAQYITSIQSPGDRAAAARPLRP